MRDAARSLAVGAWVPGLTYGTAVIVGFDAPWRREIYRPLVVSPREPWNREISERVMALDAYDASARHDKMREYDARCSCCYLNISHTVALHKARTE